MDLLLANLMRKKDERRVYIYIPKYQDVLKAVIIVIFWFI